VSVIIEPPRPADLAPLLVAAYSYSRSLVRCRW
jgi:hypothetical protein